MPRTNAAGIALLKHFEGCELVAYQDVAGIWTIGYGHTGAGVGPGVKITQEYADQLLAEDLNQTELTVQRQVQVLLNPNQFSALVCFVYNVGDTAFKESTLLKFINAKDFDNAALQFDRWVYAGGRVVQGLVNRRAAEKALFTEPWCPEPTRPNPQPGPAPQKNP